MTLSEQIDEILNRYVPRKEIVQLRIAILKAVEEHKAPKSVESCEHDWQPEWYSCEYTTNDSSKKWRCKKCLIVTFTNN